MTQAQYYGGNFLLALPGMEDMRFDHSVVALCVHDGDGALGITVGEEMDGLGLREELFGLSEVHRYSCCELIRACFSWKTNL